MSYIKRSVRCQCGGRAGYACLALERRNNNVMELRMGAVSVSGREGVCEAERFQGRAWVTLTRRGQGGDRDKEGDGSRTGCGCAR